MSIINSAHSGSDISLICLVDRELIRNGEISSEDLVNNLRPEGLTDPGKDPWRHLGWTIDFWSGQGLWGVRDDLISPLNHEDSLPLRILRTIFANKRDLRKKDVEPFIRTISCLLELDELSPIRKDLSKPPLLYKDVQVTVNRALPNFQINDAERSPLIEFGRYLGFIEQISSNVYVMDPTRAIQEHLALVFVNGQKKLLIKEFLTRLSLLIPVIDGGYAREWAKVNMESSMLTKRSEISISCSLRFALIRLELGNVISFEESNDDHEVVELTTPGRTRKIRSVEFRGATK